MEQLVYSGRDFAPEMMVICDPPHPLIAVSRVKNGGLVVISDSPGVSAEDADGVGSVAAEVEAPGAMGAGAQLWVAVATSFAAMPVAQA